MLKLATFRGVSEDGEPLVRLFDPGISMVKQAGEMMPAIQKWMDGYTPQEGKIAVLVNALGASEYYGQNVNGDLFPESALIHDCANHPGQQHPFDDFSGKIVPPYGAWTFMHALPYVHHQNKDPNRTFGKVVAWAWNSKMHRVELVILLDKMLALQHGAQHVIDRILAGEYPDISMGCRVPWDECAVCGHKSKTRKDYCACVRQFGMGKFLDDGRRVGVINYYPRFFDISFVFIGADKTAKVMCKLGQREDGLYLPQSILDAEELYGVSNDEVEGLVKAAFIQVPDNLVKLSEPRIAGVPLTVSDRILAGKIDHQENLERRAMSDGDLKTNADTNETDEVPELSTSGKGKTSAINFGRLAAHGLMGGAAGAGTGAYLGDDNRVLGGLLGGASGAAAGMGFGALGQWAGRKGGASLVSKELREAQAQGDRLANAWKSLENKRQKFIDRFKELRSKGVENLTDAEQAEGVHIFNEVIPSFTPKRSALAALAKELKPKLDYFTDASKRYQQAGGVLGGGAGAALGALGVGGMSGDIAKTGSGLQKVWADSAKMKVGPPPKPNRKEYPFTGTIDFRGLMIHVENKSGTYREGKGWRTLMRIPYGEFLGTRGIDKDKLDAYVGPYRNAPNVYIIHQNFVRGPKKGKYDEDKVMVGFESLEQAKAAYLAHYDSPNYFRSATVMAFPMFKKAIMKKEFHGEKVASEYTNSMEKRAEDLKLEDLFFNSKIAGRRSKVWRHSDGRELKRTGSGMDDWGQVKQASVKKYASLDPHALLKVSEEKWADIVKHIGPSKAVGKVSPLLSESEPDIPKPSLDTMAASGLPQALSTSSLMGMVLKPKEFQRILLQCMGKGPLADKLDDAGAVFSPNSKEMVPCEELSPNQLDPKLLEMLLPLMGEKSYFGPVVRKRIIRITISKPEPMASDTNVDSPLLSKVASAYTWYRREQMKLAADAMNIVPSIPSLHSGLYGTGIEDLFGKTAESMINPKTLGVVLGAIPLTLMYSAHLRGKRRDSKDLNMLQDLVADHPWLATAGTAAALREVMKSPKAQQAVKELLMAGKRIWKGAPPQPVL